MKQEFKDYWRKEPKNALVTGASSGMGLCYAEKLAEEGYNLLLISIDGKTMADVAERLQKHYQNQRIEYLVKDLAEENAAEDLYEYACQSGFSVNLLINNAGIFTFKDVLDISLKKIETFIGLHVSTVTKLCRLFGEQMAKPSVLLIAAVYRSSLKLSRHTLPQLLAGSAVSLTAPRWK